MGIGHRQFFITLHSANPSHKDKAVKRLKQLNHIVWYMVALEPYTGRECDDGTEHKARTAHHLHVMFRVKNQISGKKVKANWIKWWNAVNTGATEQDVYERPGEGSFADNMNYITKVPTDEHKSSEQLDPEPIIFPIDFVESPGRVKITQADIINALNDGKVYLDLLRMYPEYCLGAGSRIKTFCDDYRPIAKEVQAKRAHEEWVKRQEERKVQGVEPVSRLMEDMFGIGSTFRAKIADSILRQ